MTWPLAKPASGYIGLSRFDSDSVRPSISTSTRLGATRGRLEELAGRAVELEPDGRGAAFADPPAAGEAIDDVEPEAAAAPEVGRARADDDGRPVGILDLDVERAGAALEAEVQLGPRVGAAVADAVGHELRDQQGHVGQDVVRDTAAQLVAYQATSSRCCFGASGNVGLDGKR